MAKRLPPSHVVIKGVRYVPETADAATRRKVEREDRVRGKRLKYVAANAITLGGRFDSKRADADPALHHHVMTLSGGANSFTFEGSIILPPKRVDTAPGKGSMIVFMVGRVPAYGVGWRKPHKTLVYVNAYLDLADDILARYYWKDHVLVEGIITSLTRYGRPIVTLCCQRISLLTRHVDNAHADDANAKLVSAMVLPGGDSSEDAVLDIVFGAKQSANATRRAVDTSEAAVAT